MPRIGTSRWWAPALLTAALLIAALSAPGGQTRAAVEPQESWSFVDEQAAAESPGGRQARASIHRGDLLVALRCHVDGTRSWRTLLIGATWFVQPKANLYFTLTVDSGEPTLIRFQRETNYRFSAVEPPPEVIRRLMAGNSLTIGGPDFAGDPVTVPLAGSRAAIEGAFAICGYDPLAD